MQTRKSTLIVGLLGLLACEPTSLTDARDQLQRGGERLVRFSVPITVTNLELADFLPEEDTVTTSSGLLGLRIDPQSLLVDVGDDIEFEDIGFDPFTFDYGQVLVSDSAAATFQQSGAAAPPASNVFLTTPAGSQIVQASVVGGLLVRSFQNTTTCDATVVMSVTDSTGATVASFPPTAVTAGNSLVDSTAVSGVVIDGFVTVSSAGTNFGACVPGGGTALMTDVTVGPFVLDQANLENVNEPFTDVYSPLQSESRLQAVDTVVATGEFTVSFRNRLPVPIDVAIELQGIFKNGVNANGGTTVPAAAGDGSQTTASIVIPINGDTLLPGSVQAVVTGLAAAPTATFNTLSTGAGVEASALGDLAAELVAGPLDPDSTPELSFNVEAIEEVDASEFDFGDFEDAIRQLSLNDVLTAMDFVNGANAPIELRGMEIGVALLDGTGQVMRDTSGAIVFEVDSVSGQPILAPVLDGTDSIIRIGRLASVNLDAQLAEVFDRVINLALDDVPVALVTTGRVVVGDGNQSRISAGQQVDVSLGIVVGLDFTLGVSGVEFDVTEVNDGLDLGTADSDELASRVVTASVTSEVMNSTPFGLQVDVAYVSGNLGDEADVFTSPGRVELAPVTVQGATVGTDGVVTTPVSDLAEITVTGEEARPLLDTDLTTTVRIRLLPGTGGGGRTAVRPTDVVTVRASAIIEIRGGGSQ